MKPAQERNQECLPPKKRDLPVTNSGAEVTGGGAGGSAVGEDEVVSLQNSADNIEAQGGTKSGEWLRAQPSLHYSAESSDSVPAVPIDQYSMLYKVALPSVTYSPSSLHPVLSHISPAYTVHSPLLQHPGLPYPHPLGYAQIPHSSLQFVSSPYAVPYALPPGFVPGSLMSPTGSIPQPHAVSHLVPYPSVVQEGVVSPPPQPQVAAHSFAKVPASGVSLMLPSEHASQQHLGPILPGTELGSRGVPVFYHPQGLRASSASGVHQTSEREVNGGDKGHRSREVLTDARYVKNAHLQQLTSSCSTQERCQNKPLQVRQPEDRDSSSQRSTPDSDLEVQQVVSRLVSNVGRKEVSFAPLNLSQSTQRSKDVHTESTEDLSGRGVHPSQSASDSRMCSVQQQPVPSGHAVVIANGQPVLIPLEYAAQHQSDTSQQHYPAQVNNDMSNNSFKVSDPSAKVCLPERSSGESYTAHKAPAQPIAPMNKAVASTIPSTPSHFMKGAIIQLATGELKRIEDLQTQDFVRSAELSGGLKIDSSMVVNIHASQQRPGLVSLHFTVGEQQSKVTIDVPPEHPFFVFGQGWSSCSPERTAQLYGLPCHHLQIGDVCVSITLQQQEQQKKLQQLHPQQQQATTLSKSQTTPGHTPGPTHQVMGPPPIHQIRPLPHFRIDRIHRESQKEGDKDALDKEDAVQFVGHIEPSVRVSRASVEHPRSHSSYYLHTEGTAAGQTGASLRRWSSPGLQRLSVKGDYSPRPPMSTARPSFIPQEVKLSIEGRSNAGK